MANNYFQFKEFKIVQEVCAMKVCTDSCLFGAWTNAELSDYNINNMLDIGTGTGLLSLMLIQKFPKAQCHAIEIDKLSSEEASLNFNNSKWKESFTVYNQDFTSFIPKEKYDLIICNPPFYKKQLVSPDNIKNAAMHSTQFSIESLFKHSMTLASGHGYLSCLIPYYRTDEVIEIATRYDWFPYKICTVRQTSKHDYFRTMILFCNQPITLSTSEISIKDNNIYTDKFIDLLKEYYQKF